MKPHTLLLALSVLLALPGCAVRGGGGDDDDDDDDGGGSSAAWIRSSDTSDGETEYDHELYVFDFAGGCAAFRETQAGYQVLSDISDAEYNDIVEEFGGTEGPATDPGHARYRRTG